MAIELATTSGEENRTHGITRGSPMDTPGGLLEHPVNLRVVIELGEGLPSDPPDPHFCSIALNPANPRIPQQTRQTGEVLGTDPFWNQTIDFHLSPDHYNPLIESSVIVQVHAVSKAIGVGKLVGDCEFPLTAWIGEILPLPHPKAVSQRFEHSVEITPTEGEGEPFYIDVSVFAEGKADDRATRGRSGLGSDSESVTQSETSRAKKYKGFRSLAIKGDPLVGEKLTAHSDCELPLSYEWFIEQNDGSKHRVLGEAGDKESELTLVDETIGFYITVVATVEQPEGPPSTPKSENKRAGLERTATTKHTVRSDPPKVLRAAMKGQAAAGESLRADMEVKYRGMEGGNTISWYCNDEHIEDYKDQLAYKVTPGNVGKVISFHYTPINIHGQHGETVVVKSERVTGGNLKVDDMVMHPPGIGSTACVMYDIIGGEEGPSEFTWSESWDTVNFIQVQRVNRRYHPKRKGGDSDDEEEQIGLRPTCYVSPDDLGKVLRVTVTPIGLDGNRFPECSTEALPFLTPEWRRTMIANLRSASSTHLALTNENQTAIIELSHKAINYTVKLKKVKKKSTDWEKCGFEISNKRTEGAVSCSFMIDNETIQLRFPCPDEMSHTILTFRAFKCMFLAPTEERLGQKLVRGWRMGKTKPDKKGTAPQLWKDLEHTLNTSPSLISTAHGIPPQLEAMGQDLRGRQISAKDTWNCILLLQHILPRNS